MEGSLSLRPATLDDVAQAVRIELQVHVAPWTQENFQAELAKPYSNFLLMTDDETDSTVAGYIVFWVMMEECQIMNIAVDLPYRGLGLAKQMVRRAVIIAEQKGTKRVLLDVRKSNQPAIQLYQSHGFVITHIRKSFYSNGEDAYQMVLFLNEQPVYF